MAAYVCCGGFELRPPLSQPRSVAYLEIGEGGGHINEVWRSRDGRPLVGFSWWRSGAMGVFRGFP